MNIDDLEETFIESLADSDLSTMTTEAGDIVIDALFQEGVAREVPILGWIVKSCNVASSVSNHFFGNKIVRFLTALRETTIPERQAMIASLTVNVGDRKR